MKFFAGFLGLPVVPANLLVIGWMYAFNYLVADRYVFRLR